MSEHQEERQSVTPARADDGRLRWRSWFASTGAAPAWGLVRYLVSILMAGAPTGDVIGWAGNRLVATVLGCGIALVATYLLWPRDREDTEPVPVPAT
jgi:hypothetical protein